MKKSMTDYLYALSDNSYDTLYDIMSSKYRKFICVYWLLKDYSDNITMLKCKEKTDKDKLKITVSFSGIDTDKVADNLRVCINNSDEIHMKVHDNNIDIVRVLKISHTCDKAGRSLRSLHKRPVQHHLGIRKSSAEDVYNISDRSSGR